MPQEGTPAKREPDETLPATIADPTDEALANLTNRVNQLTATHNELVGRNNVLTGLNNELTNRNNQLTGHTVELSNEIASLTRRLEEARNARTTLEEEKTHIADALEKLATRQNQAFRDAEALADRLNALTHRNNELTDTNNALVGRINALTDINNRLTGENNRLFADAHALRESSGRLRNIVEAIEGGDLPLRSADDPDPLPEAFTDAALTVEDALCQAVLLRQIAQRVKDGYYRDRLIVIACLEKSGSTTLEICLREVLAQSGGVTPDIGIQKTLAYGPFSFVGALYPEILLYAPEGGVLRGVIRPGRDTLNLLRDWGCLSIALMRHPADRLVARYCDPTPPRFVADDGSAWRADPQRLIPDFVDPETEQEDAFAQLIGGGYLADTLDWMADWCRAARQIGGVILRYEDLITGDADSFDRLHERLYDRAMDAELRGKITEIVANYPDRHQPGDVEGRRYPHGYSGEVGIWQRYFSDANRDAYRRVVEAFLEQNPDAELVLETYPDLRI